MEPDPATAATAVRRPQEVPNVEIRQQAWSEQPHQSYDLIVFVASLHYMPLRATLRQARSAIRAGGGIVIVGVAADGPSADLASKLLSLTSLFLNLWSGSSATPGAPSLRPLTCGHQRRKRRRTVALSGRSPVRYCRASTCVAGSSGATPRTGATMAANRGRQNPNTMQLDTAVFPAFFGSARFVGRLVQPLVSSHDLLSSQGQVGWRVTPNVSPPQRVSGDGGGSVLVSLSLQRSR